jgi:hypothetical protein
LSNQGPLGARLFFSLARYGAGMSKQIEGRVEPTIYSIRLSQAIAQQVRTLAARADEKQSVILRRLIRAGLDVERRSAEAGR